MPRYIVVANETRRIRCTSGNLPEHWETVRQLPIFYVDAYSQREARSKVRDLFASVPGNVHSTIMEEIDCPGPGIRV